MRALQQRPSTLDLQEYASQIAFFKKSIPSHLTFPRRSKSIPSRAEREKTKQTKKQPRKTKRKQTNGFERRYARSLNQKKSMARRLGRGKTRYAFRSRSFPSVFFWGGIYNNNNNNNNKKTRMNVFFFCRSSDTVSQKTAMRTETKKERERERNGTT